MVKRKNIQKNQKFKEKGITLIALVITIIILLILAGVTLSTLTGDSGILNNAERATIDTEISEIEEQARLIYSELLIGTYTGETDEISMTEIVNRLKQKGYIIENVALSGEVTDIILDSTSLSIAVNGIGTIKVTYGEITKICTVTVVDTSVANSTNTLFSTAYGTIEVIWLDGTTNEVSSTPNSPA